MITAIDTHIVERLQKVKLNGVPITVYAPEEERPKGMTIPPCFGVQRYVPFRIDTKNVRSMLETFEVKTTAEVETNFNYTSNIGYTEPADIKETLTGTTEWTKKPYPTPLKLYYQIDALADTKAHYKALLASLMEVFPPRYSAVVLDRRIYFNIEGDPQNLDQLEKPLFRTVIRYEVSEVIFTRQKTTVVPGIVDIRGNIGLQEN